MKLNIVDLYPLQEQLQELSDSEQLQVQLPFEQLQSVHVHWSVEFFMMYRFVSLLTEQQVKRRMIS